ncbi:putative uncharacterized protein DDB_G0271982 isoform X2 [Mya arenaria]|uniref:putative uncharacterized protein DDB_G0271982 isoform X2 n=1 Tax=Mya arenaria TaxID=6604 RepID=UPI0022E13AAB|nr:putative uncharacterized protein DDB_G0271982 isoform X2 [Mya arenaria]
MDFREKMALNGLTVILFGLLLGVSGMRITLDDGSQEHCKKYKMCKTGKVCAVQHFDWPKNITIPVCIPLSFVPVRNMYCQLPPDTGRCHARYIRWYFNINSQDCTHFQYGGCEGNQNNFKSKADCEQTCMATPTIRLYDGTQSALVQPSIISQPVYQPPVDTKFSYEALNSVQEGPQPAHTFDRYNVARHRLNRVRADEAATRTRRRLDKEKEKERKRKERERKREKKRLRRLRKKELRRKIKREQKEKEKKEQKKNKKDKNKNILLDERRKDDDTDLIGAENTKNNVKETKNMITHELEEETENERRRKERRRERKRQKRKEKKRKRKERERRKELEKLNKQSDLDDSEERERAEFKKPDSQLSAKMFAILDQGKDSKHQKNGDERTT